MYGALTDETVLGPPASSSFGAHLKLLRNRSNSNDRRISGHGVFHRCCEQHLKIWRQHFVIGRGSENSLAEFRHSFGVSKKLNCGLGTLGIDAIDQENAAVLALIRQH